MQERQTSQDLTPETALTERYEAIAPSLYAWARCRIPPALRNAVDAADIVQEIWMRVIVRTRDFDAARGSFRQWVFGFARHVLSEMNRTGSGLPAQTVPGSGLSKLAARITTASRNASRNEGVALLLRQIHVLDEPDRKLLILRGLEGLSHEETAEQLGTNAAVVRKRWQRLRERLEEAGVPAVLVEMA